MKAKIDTEIKSFYSPKEVAKLLGIHFRTIYGNIRLGKIPTIRIGGSIRIPASFLFPQNNESQQSK